MRNGHRTRGPVGRISGVGPVDGPNNILRIRSLERVSGPTRFERPADGRTFAEVLERRQRGLGSSEPLPSPMRERPPLPPSPDDGEPLLPADTAPPRSSFLDRLWRLKIEAKDGE